MRFEIAHNEWVQKHLKKRTGERKDRLARGHSHGEFLFVRKIWWPLFGNLTNLHPEYEIVDWRGMRFFVDILYKVNDIKIAFEIKGYGPHVERTDRTKYKLELNKELFLQSLGYLMVSIPYDELEDNPELIRNFVQIIMEKYQDTKKQTKSLGNLIEQSIIRLARQCDNPIRPIDISQQLGISIPTSRKYLQRLCSSNHLTAITTSSRERVTRYKYVSK